MVKLLGLMNRFQSVRVLVIGDFVLDTYTTGTISRISPEAPVSVLHATQETSRPGGAGNVVLSLVSLGAEVVAVGRVGIDHAGNCLRHTLQHEGVDIRGIYLQEEYRTPVKNRFIANAQQVLRVDFETLPPISSDLEAIVLNDLHFLLDKVHIIAISDYAKGFLTPKILRAWIDRATERNIPVIVDPKGSDFAKYAGAMMIKPNLQEAYVAANLPNNSPLSTIAETIFQRTSIPTLVVTRGEGGISLFQDGRHCMDFPVLAHEVKDVTGAGDTVLAVLAVSLANQLDITEALPLANIAAGIAVERIGCARVELGDIVIRLSALDADNKIFYEEHIFALQQALANKRYCILAIEGYTAMTHDLFRAIRNIASSDPARHLMIYLHRTEANADFLSMLAYLTDIDFIILKGDNPLDISDILETDAIFSLRCTATS